MPLEIYPEIGKGPSRMRTVTEMERVRNKVCSEFIELCEKSDNLSLEVKEFIRNIVQKVKKSNIEMFGDKNNPKPEFTPANTISLDTNGDNG